MESTCEGQRPICDIVTTSDFPGILFWILPDFKQHDDTCSEQNTCWGVGGVKSLEIDHFARKALGAGHYSGRGASGAGTYY